MTKKARPEWWSDNPYKPQFGEYLCHSIWEQASDAIEAALATEIEKMLEAPPLRFWRDVEKLGRADCGSRDAGNNKEGGSAT